MATVLIIYYKQISEGYDDRERYQIMQKVGMSKKEVRHSIRSQVLLVFFLPLITSRHASAVASDARSVATRSFTAVSTAKWTSRDSYRISPTTARLTLVVLSTVC